MVDDEVIGLICIDSQMIGAYTEEDGEIAFALASQAAQAIRNAMHAEVSRVQRACPGVVAVAFNGNTAARAAPRWREAGYATVALPSTSPAYTRPLAEKIEAWRALEAWL